VPNGTLRRRYSLLGDIIHSQPIYVGAPAGDSILPGYATFKNSQKNRAGRVYVGANDGMLHVFDAQDGSEVYAYVPSMLIGKMKELTKASYLHKYFVDGQLVAADISVDDTWKTILAGGVGAGAKGLFALDITDANLSSETSLTAADKKVIWERTDSALGHIHGRPRIAMLPDGKAYVVTGNGYGSADGTAKLFLAPLNGDSTRTITTGTDSGNGLSSPALVDKDSDGIVDYAYAGDLRGSLWRFDLASGAALELFSAGINKPITTAPDVAAHPFGGYLIYFGTGSLLSRADAENIDQQTIYAIWDKPGNVSTVQENTLLSQTLTGTVAASGVELRISTDNSVNWSTNDGWKVDLPASGERLIGNPQMRGKRLQFVTHSPDRSSWLLGLDWLTGGDPKVIQYDLNADKLLGTGDMVTVEGSDRFPVGLSLGVGNISQPVIARVANGVDIDYINGVLLPEYEPCEGDCVGGLARGHIDVDMDTMLGGSTDWHKHEYDDSYNITYVDYLDLKGGTPIDQVGIGDSTNVIVILANADLSPGGVLTIGNKKWNVVDYQEMVQKKLREWDGSSTLVDDDGDPLVFTLGDIVANGGTLRTSFNSATIGSGGVIPSVTGCVKGNAYYAETGRWRNGALTLHVLNFDALKASADPTALWYEQTPVDLAEGMVGGGLIANPENDAAFMYESTVFWHWDGAFAKVIVGDGGMCYGEPGWREAYLAEIAGINSEVLEKLFPGYAQNEKTVNDLLSQLDNYTCAKGVGAQCAKENGYIAILGQLESVLPGGTELVKFRIKFREYLDNGGGTVEGGNGSGVPVDVIDRTEDLIPVLGPRIRLGRRSWIDP